MNRTLARLSTLAGAPARFRAAPEPLSIGTPERGRQLAAGQFLLAGHLVEAPGTAPWDLPQPSPGFAAALHGFAWLDDLAAVGDRQSAMLARDWTRGWLAAFGRGRGPGWTPQLTGRRLIRWIGHSALLLAPAGPPDPRAEAALLRALGQQMRFLSRRWTAAPGGLPRIEALTGLILAALALEGGTRLLAPAQRGLERDCRAVVDADGALPGRNPEALLEIFALLTWSAAALEQDGRAPGPEHRAALARIAPVLRALRHADGGLARFHGGDRGAEGRLDRALAAARVRPAPRDGLAMGFARLSHGRTTVIVDAAAPPEGEASAAAHASTLAFELTSGRRPVIVSCGPGGAFGAKWDRAGRATASHSTLALDGYSSARLGLARLASGGEAELLVEAPRDVRVEPQVTELSSGLVAGHDGYLASHGLTHVRQLHLDADGRGLHGEDVLATVEREDERRFDQALAQAAQGAIPFRLRFHLHPEVAAEADASGHEVRLTLRSGEIWRFRHTGRAKLALEPSVYLENTALAPRATKQIVLSSAAREYATRVSWSLAKAQETPGAVRDLERDDVLALT